jgi:hypothetical protein
MSAPSAVGGRRLSWPQVPAGVRAAVVAAAGSPVRSATSRPGGFSPGLASVLRLVDGRSVFVKAVNAARNPESPALHRREAEVLAALPGGVPTPRLLWSYDDGDWVALMIEAVDGRLPAQPWRPDELAAFLRLAAGLVDQLTPAPVEAPAIEERFRLAFTGWRRLASDPATARRIDPWVYRHLDRLAGLERDWPAAASGATLLHADLRADNVLLTNGGPVAVDWPHACLGAGWVDLLLALPSVAMHGGGDPEEIWAGYPPAARADPQAVTAVLAAVTGFFLHQSLRPAPPNLPRVRDFQAAQGRAGLAWLRRRLT